MVDWFLCRQKCVKGKNNSILATRLHVCFYTSAIFLASIISSFYTAGRIQIFAFFFVYPLNFIKNTIFCYFSSCVFLKFLLRCPPVFSGDRFVGFFEYNSSESAKIPQADKITRF